MKFNLATLNNSIFENALEKANKDITIDILKGKSPVKIAEESNELSLDAVRSLFVSTIRKAITNSPYAPDSELSKENWIKIVKEYA